VGVNFTIEPMHNTPMKLLNASADLPDETFRYESIPHKLRMALRPFQVRHCLMRVLTHEALSHDR
jgi:hypothetical protein